MFGDNPAQALEDLTNRLMELRLPDITRHYLIQNRLQLFIHAVHGGVFLRKWRADVQLRNLSANYAVRCNPHSRN
ncbi:hypothetical protein FLP41_03645 (plasmid) [Paracoccus marcusii]|nr:hypothetical protein FLP41_03645 [Paracoccus marcusii]